MAVEERAVIRSKIEEALAATNTAMDDAVTWTANLAIYISLALARSALLNAARELDAES